MTLTQSDRQVLYAAQAIKRRQSREAKRARVKGVVKPGDRVREPLYLAFIRRQPCAAMALGGCDGPIEAAHVRFSDFSQGRVNPGMQKRPSDEFCLPLCASHHRTGPKAQHSMNERAFWRMVGIEPAILMSHYRLAYIGVPNA